MKDFVLGWLLVAMAMLPIDAIAGAIRRVPEPVPNEYIVVLRDDLVPPDAVSGVASEHALAHRGRVLVTLTNGLRGYGIALPEAAAARITADPRVRWVEQNAYGHLSASEAYPDDRKWHLNRIDQRPSVPSVSTKTYEWTSTGSGVDVYVVDTGVQSAHTEFDQIWVDPGANYAGADGFAVTNPCGGWISKYNGGHGTAVASLVAGRTVGVARGATIIPVKIATCNTAEPTPENREIRIDTIGVLWGLDWVLATVRGRAPRTAVVNMSFYFDQYQNSFCPADPTHPNSWDCRTAFEHNINNLLQENVVVVASANNQSRNNCAEQTPARFGYGGIYDPNFDTNPDNDNPNWRGVITVGGTNINDQRYTCPTCGDQDAGSNFGPCVSIYAPAHGIQSAHIAGSNSYRDEQPWLTQAINNSFYPSFTTLEHVHSGTSFASPIVAGVVARLRQSHPSKDVRQLWDYIYGSATALPANFDGDGITRNDKLVYISGLE